MNTSTATETAATDNFWADAEVIHAYSRADALRDGALVDMGDLAKEAGFRFPVAMTSAAHADTVAWTEADEKAKPHTCQDETGRAWDVLNMARLAAQTNKGRDRVTFQVLRVPRPGCGRTRLVTLVLHIGPGDTAAPVVTIMFPSED